MEKISFEDFKKIDIRIGRIISAEKIKDSEKLLKLDVDFTSEKRQIIAGIGKLYSPESLIGKECPFAFNIETRELKGMESQGMILCADDSEPVLLHPDKDISPGSIVK